MKNGKTVRKSTCEFCTHYEPRTSTFGVCRYGGPAVTRTTDRGEVCGNHTTPPKGAQS